jgi:hypothetical protein
MWMSKSRVTYLLLESEDVIGLCMLVEKLDEILTAFDDAYYWYRLVLE